MILLKLAFNGATHSVFRNLQYESLILFSYSMKITDSYVLEMLSNDCRLTRKYFILLNAVKFHSTR